MDILFHYIYLLLPAVTRAGARTLIGGGGLIFIYSSYARLISFEINFNTKEISWAEPEYMNIHTPINVLAPALAVTIDKNSEMHEQCPQF